MPLDEERHSKALEIELISDPEQKARQEAQNGLRQFDEVVEMIDYWLHPERPFKLRVSAILTLHRRALERISSFAGVFRPGGIEIKGSKHTRRVRTSSPKILSRCATTSTKVGRKRLRSILQPTLYGA
jgi:hypothetical protein